MVTACFSPNCEFVWNPKTGRREIWSCQRVEEGEELTISYSRLDRRMPRRVRRTYLRECFQFDCFCVVCNKTKEQNDEEEQQYLEMKNREEEEQRMEEEQFLISPHYSHYED